MGNNIGENIKTYRLLAKMTLLEVAKKLGVQEATVQRYESGAIKNIKYDTIVELAKMFDVTPQMLLGWKKDEEKKQPVGYEQLKPFVDAIQTMSDEEKSDLMNYMNFIISKRK